MIMGLLFTAAFIGSGICCAISNADSKKNTYHRDSNGNAHWMDRKGTEYVNGEKLFTIDSNIDKEEFMEDIERRRIPVKSYWTNQHKKNRK